MHPSTLASLQSPPLLDEVTNTALPLPHPSRMALSLNQGWVGPIQPAELDKVNIRHIDVRIHLQLLVRYQTYLESMQRQQNPDVPSSRSEHRNVPLSSWEEWGTHIETDQMGPWQGSRIEGDGEGSTAALNEPALPSYQPEARVGNSVERCAFCPLD